MARKDMVCLEMAAVHLLTMLVVVSLGQDPGFNLLFTTNGEELLDVPIQFHPSLPSWLMGTLVRDGMGQFENGDRMFLHAFDGFAKLACWHFYGNGSTTFSTRFLRSHFYNDSMARDTIAAYLLFEGPQPPFDLPERLTALVRGLDNMNVNVHRFPGLHGDDDDVYMALNDYFAIYTFSPYDLSTGARVNGVLKEDDNEYGEKKDFFLHLLSSSHPLVEAGTNNLLTFVSSVSLLPGQKNLIQVIRLGSSLMGEVVASIKVDKVPYMHSFSVTESHVLLLAHPFYVEVLCMLAKATPFNCLRWHGDMPSTLYVVDLRTGHVDHMTMDNVFTMHHVNAYDDQGRIIMDISAYPDPSFVGNLTLAVLRDSSARNSFPAHAQLQRYAVNLKDKSVQRLPLPPPRPAYINLLDMPRINEHHRSLKHCYVYGVVVKTDNISLSSVAVVKRDVCGTQRDKALIIPSHYPAEAVFVPKPLSIAEDDGVLLVPMFNGTSGQSYLAIINAMDMKIVSTAILPTRVPWSLHGSFFHDLL